MRILYAEDEVQLAKTVQEGLVNAGYEVDLVFDGSMAERLFERHTYECILLDINLPLKNGFELCKSFRSKDSRVPIIMLTALGDVEDKQEAFSSGSDDYLVKPFHIKELLLRIKALQRRLQHKETIAHELQVADLTLDSEKKEVRRAGKLVKLSAKEFLLLEVLMRAKGRVLSKSHLLEEVWGIDYDTGTNQVEVYINFLRSKIDKQSNIKLIHTKQGFGYFMKEEL